MDLQFTPLNEALQKKLISIALRADEPRVALLLNDEEGNEKVFFIDTEKGQILLPKKPNQEEKDGGGQLDEVREGNVSEELQPEAKTDRQGEEGSSGPSEEV